MLKSGRPASDGFGSGSPTSTGGWPAQIARESRGDLPAARHEGAAQQQIARQVADERELGRHGQIGALTAGFARRVRNQPGIAREVADERD